MGQAGRFLIAGLVLLCAGCETRHTLTVNLTVGYKGDVVVTCTSLMHTDGMAQTDMQGQASASCPSPDPELVVYRGKRKVSPADVQWSTTGDGLPTRVTFSVR